MLSCEAGGRGVEVRVGGGREGSEGRGVHRELFVGILVRVLVSTWRDFPPPEALVEVLSSVGGWCLKRTTPPDALPVRERRPKEGGMAER